MQLETRSQKAQERLPQCARTLLHLLHDSGRHQFLAGAACIRACRSRAPAANPHRQKALSDGLSISCSAALLNWNLVHAGEHTCAAYWRPLEGRMSTWLVGS